MYGFDSSDAFFKGESTTDCNWLIVNDPVGLQNLERDWQRLFASNPRHTPFQSWAWTSAWLRHLAGPHRLHIICCHDESGGLLFVLPLVSRDTVKTGESTEYFIACGYGPECSDHLGPLSVPDLDSRLAEFTAFALNQFVSGSARVSLTSMDAFDNFPEQLCAKVADANRHVRLTDYRRCPSVELPGSWHEFLQGLSRNFRSQIARYRRKLGRHHSAELRTIAPEDATYFVEELIRLNRLRIADKGEQSSLADPAFRAFMREAVPSLVREGLAWMDVVTDKEKVVGAALNLVHADRVYYYLGGFDKSHAELRPGNMLFAEAIRRGISEHYASYNFLRGTEAYKYRWGTRDLITWRLDIYPQGLLRGMLASRKDEILGKWRRSLARARENVLRDGNRHKNA